MSEPKADLPKLTIKATGTFTPPKSGHPEPPDNSGDWEFTGDGIWVKNPNPIPKQES